MVTIRRRERGAGARQEDASGPVGSTDTGDAFAQLYRAHVNDVYRFCFAHLRDRADAEDATSQTFLKALHAFHRYRECGTAKPWLLSIARHVIVDLHRQAPRLARLDDTVSEVADLEATPETSAIARMELERIERALQGLPIADREVLELRRSGLNGIEIAAVLNISHEAAKKRQLRALERLETAMLRAEERRYGA